MQVLCKSKHKNVQSFKVHLNQFHFQHYVLYNKKKRNAEPHFHHVVTSEHDLIHPPPTPVRPVFLIPASPMPAKPNQLPDEVDEESARFDEDKKMLTANCDFAYGDVVAQTVFHGKGSDRLPWTPIHDFIIYHDEKHSSSTFPRRGSGLAIYAAHGFLEQINCSVMTVR